MFTARRREEEIANRYTSEEPPNNLYNGIDKAGDKDKGPKNNRAQKSKHRGKGPRAITRCSCSTLHLDLNPLKLENRKVSVFFANGIAQG
jgi:hypothetical protein